MRELIEKLLNGDFDIKDDRLIIKVKDNIFDYQDNDKAIPLNNNSFVADLETYVVDKDTDNQNPIISIIAYAGLSYLTKNSRDKKKAIPNYYKEFNPTILDIVNDTNENNLEERETDIFIKMLENMIQQVKNNSNSKNKDIMIYMFNSSGYDNSFLIKLLSRLGYIQTLDADIHKNVKNLDELQHLKDKVKILLNQLKDINISDEDKAITEKEIKAIRNDILKKAKYETNYKKEFTMLSNTEIGNLTIKFGYKDYRFQVVDVMRFYPSKLKDLGKIVGIDKLIDVGEKYYDRHPDSMNAKEWDEYRYYATIDIEILWKAIQKLSNQISFDKKRILTISSMTLDKWKENNPVNKKFYRIEYDKWYDGKLGYRGGFTFCNEKYLNKTLNNVNSYDINSSYPSSMLKPIACSEITADDVEESKKLFKVAKYMLVEFHNFKLKDNMLPIIPLLYSNLPNAFFKDYNFEKQRKIIKAQNKESNENILPYQMWVWEEEFEWFQKFYTDLEYRILDNKYYLCRGLFVEYIKENYIRKAQADIDKVICNIIKDYLKNKDKTKVYKSIEKTFPKYFNDKNTLLSKHIDYNKEYKRVIETEMNKIDKLDSKGIDEYNHHLENQLLYLEIVRNTTKLFLNSLYGKFGQNPDMSSNFITDIVSKRKNQFTICVNDIIEDYHTYEIENEKNHKVIDKNVYSIKRVDKTKEKANNVYISSYITMLSRCKLYEVIYKYGNDRILYGDTDSVKMFGELDEEYINNTELGKWKYEGTYETFAFIGSKKYMFREDDEVNFHIAGVNGIDESRYPDFRSNREIQDILFYDFTHNNLKGKKKGAKTDKKTGIKIISDKEINIKDKDLELSYISINDRYNKIFKKD